MGSVIWAKVALRDVWSYGGEKSYQFGAWIDQEDCWRPNTSRTIRGGYDITGGLYVTCHIIKLRKMFLK